MSPRRVLVAGYGMAAARLAEEIRAHDPDGRRVALTIAGAEPAPPYNRVLLTGVLAGKIRPPDAVLHDDGWAAAHRVQVRRGAVVTAVQPGRRRAVLADGSAVSYDDLVLATGSRPVLPPVAGLRGPGRGWAPGATAFRTLGDCLRIQAAATPGSRAAVLGGGLLGLETARGLAARGVRVTVLQAAGHLMERQLDENAAKILAERLRAMGIHIRLGARAVKWCPAPGASAGSGVLYLAGGTAVPCDAVIVAAGVRPDIRLAAAAGLRTSSGVVVDDRLATSDPAIRAVGDCAEHPGAVAGQVQPAWEQAAVLAGLLTGADPAARYRGTPAVTRLRAEGIELASIGDPHADRDLPVDRNPHGHRDPRKDRGSHRDRHPHPGHDRQAGRDGPAETLRLEDPVHGRYGKLTLRGGRVAGAIMLGLPDAAATITALFDRAAPVPSDHLGLLLGRARPPAGRFSPDRTAAVLPDGAVLCHCNMVTTSTLIAAWRRGARTVPDLAAATRAATGCGSCADDIGGVARWLARERGDGPGGSAPERGDGPSGPAPERTTDGPAVMPGEEVVA